MADTDFKPVTPAEAERMMAHMNSEHSSSLTHYLEFYGRLQKPVKPALTALNSYSMTVEHGPAKKRKQWVYTFEPRLGAGEGRRRLVGMHNDAREGLGLSDVTINHVILSPLLIATILLFLTLQLALAFAPPAYILSYCSFAAPYVAHLQASNGQVPTRASVAYGIRVMMLAPFVGLHVLEVFTSLKPLLKRYNVQSRRVRWSYIVLTAISGFPVWRALRIKGQSLERKLKADKAKSGHAH